VLVATTVRHDTTRSSRVSCCTHTWPRATRDGRKTVSPRPFDEEGGQPVREPSRAEPSRRTVMIYARPSLLNRPSAEGRHVPFVFSRRTVFRRRRAILNAFLPPSPHRTAPQRSVTVGRLSYRFDYTPSPWGWLSARKIRAAVLLCRRTRRFWPSAGRVFCFVFTFRSFLTPITCYRLFNTFDEVILIGASATLM